MKKLLFLFFCFIIMIEPVLADDNLRFYNTKEKVDGMWITRIDGDKSDYNSPFVLKFNIIGCSLSKIFAKIASFVCPSSNSYHNNLYSLA